jgi:CRISPR-associated protein Csy1
LEDAAKRVLQLKAVTHILKALNTEASGSSLFCSPKSFSQTDFLGSHALPEDFAFDVVGNAAALDVDKFLRQIYEGRTLLEWLEAGDPDALAALDPDPEKAAALAEAFLGLKKKPAKPASHTLAKQVYWLAGDDPTDDVQFHLLAPLFPSSLVQAFFQKVQADRFGEEAKAARTARKSNAWHENEVRDYPDLAIQKIGGAQPQNVSQLNSERRGVNYLFPALPPVWVSRPIRPPKGDSLFTAFGRRPKALKPTLALKKFLASNPPANRETRKQRDTYLREIIDEFMNYSTELQSLPPGWTKEAACRLPQEEKDWLEPDFREASYDLGQPDETLKLIIQRFANWLNSRLERVLPVGEVEQAFWADALNLALKEADLD